MAKVIYAQFFMNLIYLHMHRAQNLFYEYMFVKNELFKLAFYLPKTEPI